MCCETNHEGNIDYGEFTGRFLDPAKEIGFNLAVLLTNLSEHMPSEPRLARFLETAGTVLNYFEPFLGRIEIRTADKIERVYFEIDENNIEQWEKPQIKESKKAFFYATITEGGDKEKLECFVDFCEDAIFEMQHAESLMSSGADKDGVKDKSAPKIPPSDDEPRGIVAPLKEKMAEAKEAVFKFFKLFHPASIKETVAKAKSMTFVELLLLLVTSMFWSVYGVGSFVVRAVTFSYSILLSLMRGSEKAPKATDGLEGDTKRPKKAPISKCKILPMYIHICF